MAFYIWGAHWRHLKNTTEPSMCGGNAALCQITLTTCLSVEECLLKCFSCDGCSKAEFDRIISKWVLKESVGETKITHPWKVSETDLWSQSDKVCAVVDQ